MSSKQALVLKHQGDEETSADQTDNDDKEEKSQDVTTLDWNEDGTKLVRCPPPLPPTTHISPPERRAVCESVIGVCVCAFCVCMCAGNGVVRRSGADMVQGRAAADIG